ncbi:NYN domain-containing protein [Rhodococcus ruber]|uniref:NYN domain-containing protein n=1 Tax=Rhodococcus ruber TaxID=1830 RepID=UPI00167DFBD7|nr:NYN domain-containing protein [Rhodococcus ruber]
MDLENLLGGRIGACSVAEIWCEYRQVTGMRWDDHVIVAVSKKNAVATFFALPGTVQRVVGSDVPDGADLALIGAVDIAWTARRFGQVMAATGDGIFAGTAARLHAQGLQVVQVIGAGLPATGLYRQCQSPLYLTTTQRLAQTRRHAELTAALSA